MEKGKKISMALFGLIIICFLLPFVSVSCGGQEIAKLSGMDMVTGTSMGQAGDMDPVPLAIIALVAALIGLGICFWKNNKGNLVAALAGIVGFINVIILKSKFDEEVINQGGSTEWGAGYYLTLVLFLAAAVYSLFTARSKEGLFNSVPLPHMASPNSTKFCPDCGAKNDYGDGFCNKCGTKFPVEGYDQAAAKTDNETNNGDFSAK